MLGKDVVIAIPARIGSRRLPNKPLVKVLGEPLILLVVRAVKDIGDNIVVATDSKEIADVVSTEGVDVVMTPPDLPSGTDRIARALRGSGFRYIVNVQCDEPLVKKKYVLPVVESLRGGNPYATVASSMCGDEDARNPDVVKVVVDMNGFALYFSRSPIPFVREGESCYLRHMGIYGYTMESLMEFVSWEEGKLEKIEKLEQLRILERGYKIHVSIVDDYCIGVDTAEDIVKVERLLKEKYIL